MEQTLPWMCRSKGHTWWLERYREYEERIHWKCRECGMIGISRYPYRMDGSSADSNTPPMTENPPEISPGINPNGAPTIQTHTHVTKALPYTRMGGDGVAHEEGTQHGT